MSSPRTIRLRSPLAPRGWFQPTVYKTWSTSPENAAQLPGVTIIGLPLLKSTCPNLDDDFTVNFITPCGFVTVASGFNAFEAAINPKLEFEITCGVPEPGTCAMLGCAHPYRKD